MSDFQFSDRTREIIANFSGINPQLLFREGNVLKTMSAMKDFFASATIVETIPQEFAIYDLSRFLGALSLFKSPIVVFKEKALSIKEDNRQVNYVYAAASMLNVVAPDKEMNLPETIAEFDFTAKALIDTRKALQLLSLPQIAFVSDGKTVILQAIDEKNPTGDTYFCKVGESPRAFKVILNAEKISKILADDYKVMLKHNDKKDVVVFESKDMKFFILPEQESQFDE